MVSHISTYFEHSGAVMENGEVYTWGSSHKKILGHQNNYPEPNLVEVLRTCIVKQVSCGEDHSAVITNNGKVYIWGENGYGQLGLGHKEDLDNCAHVAALEGIAVMKMFCGKKMKTK